VEDWKFVEKDPSEALARLHFFSIKKKHASGEVEARITVKEFASAKTTDMKFFAVADLELNQKTAKFQPCGWAETMMGALTECLRNLRKFELRIHRILEQRRVARHNRQPDGVTKYRRLSSTGS
jgi:hypothetical protein